MLASHDEQAERVIRLERPAYSLDEFEREFATSGGQGSPSGGRKSQIRKKLKNYASANFHPLKLFSIINLFVQYNPKQYLIADFLSGLTGMKKFGIF